ncbi:MAG: hypothetical protein R3F60_29250 [bacterium]
MAPCPPGPRRAGPDEGFKFFCLDVEGDEPRIRAVGGALQAAARCAGHDRLQFTWSSRADGDRHLSLFAVGPEGIVWYWPRAGAEPLVGPAADAPLPGSFSLASSHPEGPYRIIAVTGDVGLTEAEARIWWTMGGDSPALIPGHVMEGKLEVGR